MTRKRTTILRLSVAALIALPGLLSFSGAASAAPSKAQVDAAKAKYNDLTHQAEVISEQLNTAQTQLDAIRVKEANAKHAMDTAQAAADSALKDLNARETAAYTSQGSQLSGILGSNSFSDFSDRIAYMSAIASHDADLATRYQSAKIQADAARAAYSSAAAQASAQVKVIADRKQQLLTAAANAKQVYIKLYGSWHAAQVAAAKAAAAAEHQTGGNGGGGPIPPPPPGNGDAAAKAIQAAYSVIGTPYVWGGASPSGFDCSGLVMWSYAQAGVSLPHSSLMMSQMLPHVSYADLIPGDLVFFYTPVSHVGLYIGGGNMIDADHPGAGGEVAVRSVSSFGSFDFGGRVSG